MSLVSIVILSFNSKHLLPRAVESVLAQTHPATELIIVDNDSVDGTRELLETYRSSARVILLNENTGYACGMNRGYRESSGAFFIPLNADAVLHPEFISEAVRLFREHAELGVVAPEVKRIPEAGEWRFWEDEEHGYESEGGVVALSKTMRVRVIEEPSEDLRPSFKANGACPVIRRALVEETERRFGHAPFDPVFDTYGEDVDFAFKAWSLRWETRYARRCLAGHVRSYASPVERQDKRGRLRINLIAERYINSARHLPFGKLIAVVASGLVEDASMLLRQLGRGDFLIIEDAGAALARVALLLPHLISFRRRHRTWRSINFEREVYCETTGANKNHFRHKNRTAGC